MTLAPNLRLPLNGSRILPLLLLAPLLLSACNLFQPVPPKPNPDRTSNGELDPIQPRRVLDPETGTYVIIQNAPVERMDTIRWRDIPVNPDRIITSGTTEVFTGTQEPTAPQPTRLDTRPINQEVNSEFFSVYNVVITLPFLTDRFSPNATLPNGSEWALHFYGGARLALEDLQAEGINLNVSVIDGRETSEPAAAQVVRTNADLQNAHLIIGPYRRETARYLADLARTKDKTVMSPATTANDVTSNNPNYIQASPGLPTHCEAITRHILQRYRPEQVVLVARDKPEELERLAYFQNEYARRQGTSTARRFRDFIVRDNATDINNMNVLSLLQHDTTVIVVPSWSSETFIYSLMRKLDLARKASTQIVIYGMPQWMDFEMIDYDYYERLNVHVSNSTYINPLFNETQFFRRRFYDRYGAVPRPEGYMGYDLTLFCGRMLKKYGTKFQYYLENEPTQMLHTRFEFERVVTPTTTSGTENLPIQRFENKYVNILRFRDYQFRLAD